MGGIRIGGVATVVACSPPFSVFELSAVDCVNLFRSCTGDAAGTPTQYTNYADSCATTDQMSNMVLSPNGAKIIYEQWNPSSGFPEVWVDANTPLSTPTSVVVDGSQYCRYPQWAPDNDTITYTRSFGTSVGGAIETISVTGGSPTVLYTPASGYSCFRPSFNFDGTSIAFWLHKDTGNTATEGLYSMDSDGTNVVQLTTSQNYNLDGSQHGWATTQDVIAYFNGVADAFTINRDGTGNNQINANGPISGFPTHISWSSWAPADAFIVATGFNGSEWLLYRLETDGSNSTLLDATHGAVNQQYMKQAFVYHNRAWFIEGASNASQGLLSSMTLSGTDYVNNLDLTAGAVGDFFYGGSGFELE